MFVSNLLFQSFSFLSTDWNTTNQDSPFSIRVLHGRKSSDVHSPGQLYPLLPSIHRRSPGELISAGRDITACIEKELDLDRLTDVQTWLWVAGLPFPPRALHRQLLLGRQIFVTEQMDMHLVWTTGRIFLKPLPSFLLDPDFWSQYLTCPRECRCIDKSNETFSATQQRCKQMVLRRRALGFLFSYAALISHESDFSIAKDKYLLPVELKWSDWRVLVDQLDTQHIYPYIDPRFIHGELRLSRLNKIYIISFRSLEGYMPRWNEYSAFFHDYFTWLASGTIYIAIVLSAMQVGLATDSLQDSKIFQSASYGFTVFSIMGPIIAAFLIFIQFFGIFVWNWAKADLWKKIRYSQLIRQWCSIFSQPFFKCYCSTLIYTKVCISSWAVPAFYDHAYFLEASSYTSYKDKGDQIAIWGCYLPLWEVIVRFVAANTLLKSRNSRISGAGIFFFLLWLGDWVENYPTNNGVASRSLKLVLALNLQRRSPLGLLEIPASGDHVYFLAPIGAFDAHRTPTRQSGLEFASSGSSIILLRP